MILTGWLMIQAETANRGWANQTSEQPHALHHTQICVLWVRPCTKTERSGEELLGLWINGLIKDLEWWRLFLPEYFNNTLFLCLSVCGHLCKHFCIRRKYTTFLINKQTNKQTLIYQCFVPGNGFEQKSSSITVTPLY